MVSPVTEGQGPCPPQCQEGPPAGAHLAQSGPGVLSLAGAGTEIGAVARSVQGDD